MARGTKRNDKWKGDEGNDIFKGLAGDDLCNGGLGNDIIDGGAGGDDIIGGAGNDNLTGGTGDDSIEGGAGNDIISAGAGSDTVEGGSGRDTISGGAGDDNLDGGSGRDTLDGGEGNDFIAGGTGNDRLLGGSGDDTLVWNDGDGNDLVSGGEGIDTVQVNGSSTRGDNFVLRALRTIPNDGKAVFVRTGLDGQPVDQFALTVDTAEVFDIKAEGGNDTLFIGDVSGTGIQDILFSGGAGNDTLDAKATSSRITADGGEGDDILTGGTGTITLRKPDNTTFTVGDTLTGGAGKDKFQFLSDPFAGGVAGQDVNQPDVITDYEIGQDQIVLGKERFGLNVLKFQSGNSGQLSGNSNLLVLTNPFANAGAAAAAIRDNNSITADKGAFVYFNTTLGISRVVFSEDLANGGRFSVLANLNNQTNPANQANFTAADFSLT